MDKKNRFYDAFQYLRSIGIVHTQKDLAERIGSSQANISSALKGVERVLTDRFLHRFNIAFDGIFNEDWLLYGKGTMLNQQQPIQHSEGNNSPNIMGDNNNVGVGSNITITHARAYDSNVLLKPVVNKQLAALPNTDVYKVVSGDGMKLQKIMAFPQYDDFDFYYQVSKDAMSPNYEAGDILALMHLPSHANIIQGAAMVVDTNSVGFIFRRIYDRGDYYECKCINENSVFEDQPIPKDDVIRLYRVVYSIKAGD